MSMSEALITALEKRSLKAIQAAIEGGADINAGNTEDDGMTALCTICKSRSGVMSNTETAIAMWLLEHGADATKGNEYQETPLHFAAGNGTVAMVDALVARGAKVTRTRLGLTPMFYCLSTHDKDIAMWDRLLELGCGLEDLDGSGRTALLDAVTSHNPAAVKYLLAKGANRDAMDSDGKTAMDYAVEYKNEKIQKLLAKK